MADKLAAEVKLTSSELKALEAKHRPVAAFSEVQPWSIDEALWQRRLAAFEAKRQEVSEATSDKAVEMALRAAAVDTGAKEGLYPTDRGMTASIAEEEPGWQKLLTEKGPQVLPTFEAQLAAYRLSASLALSPLPINEATIRQLHTEMVKAQDSYTAYIPDRGAQEQRLPKGEYKKFPNIVVRADGSKHAYTPVADVPEAMKMFVEQLRSPQF